MSIQPWDHNDLRDAAIAYATSGHRVFPTVPFGKMPLLPKPEKGDPELSPLADWQDREKGGFHAAVNEPGYVGALWAAVAKGANIGLGIPPGVVVLDLDDRGDDSAIELLTEQHGMLADLLASADTFRVRSPSGMHIYFKTTADLTTSHANGGVYSGVRAIVDIKVGGKTYVLLPPSQKSDGRRYAHLAGDLSQLAELPEEWVAALQDGAGRHSGRSAAPRAGARPRAQLKPSLHTSDGPQRLPAEPLPDGTARHPILFREACAMRERGYLEAEILPLMRALNRRLFTTPKDADLLQTMVADVCGRYAVGDIEPPASSTETADFTSTELYRELSRMFGERESLDYLLDAVCAPRATAPRRVLCVRGDVDSAAGLFDALERGFGAAAVGHLPYAALIPGAQHTRRTDYFSSLDGRRLVLFAGGPRDPKFHVGMWSLFAQRGVIPYSRKGEGAAAPVRCSTLVHVNGVPDVRDPGMRELSAVFPIALGRIDPTDAECKAMVEYGRRIHEPGRSLPEANRMATAYYFPVEPWTEATRELDFSRHFVDGRDGIRAMVQAKFAELAPSLPLPPDNTIPASLGLLSRNTRVNGEHVRGYSCKTTGRWAFQRQPFDRLATGI